MPYSPTKPRPRWPIVVAGSILLAAASFWAGRLTLTPPATTPEGTDDMVSVAVIEQSVGQTLDYGVRVTRAVAPLATNSLSGVVTAVNSDPLEPKETGDSLFSVAGVPVRVVEGKTPFYRDLGKGTKGPDVKQLELALVALGHLDSADSTFDSATEDGVSSWQKSLGIAQTGAVQLGELIAAPALPGVVVLDEDIVWKGAVLSGGEVVASMGTGDPTFVLPLTPGQETLVPVEAPMTVEGLGKEWPARWASSKADDELGVGQLVTLSAPDGGAVCADECSLIPATQTWLTVHIEVVPRSTGPVVPVSAITTEPDGSAWVTVVSDGTRERREVTVQRSHAGLSVVDGVSVGEHVQVLASESATGASDTVTGSPSPEPSAAEPSASTTP